MRPAFSPTGPEQCPFLVPVMADQLWLYPAKAYCRRPNGHIRVPSDRTTLPCICMTAAYLVCPGYLEAVEERESRVPA